MKNIIEIENVTKIFDEHVALNNIDLSVREGEFLTILGPSGCGKTTLLRLIAGFEQPNKGLIEIDGASMIGKEAHRRPVNTVFQNYALFPHLNVFGNVAFGLKIAKVKPTEIRLRVKRILELVGLAGYENRSIDAMSGGQRQRVALARALVNKPKVLLLDEPLSALDKNLRETMQFELRKIQKELGITFVFVTHDQEEALTMSDRIVVMDHGTIQQLGTPSEIYDEPFNKFVAKFIGQSNIIEDAVWIGDGNVKFFNKTIKTTDAGFEDEEFVDIILRPEDIDIVEEGGGFFNGIVSSIIYKGQNYEVLVATEMINFRKFDANTDTDIELLGTINVTDSLDVEFTLENALSEKFGIESLNGVLDLTNSDGQFGLKVSPLESNNIHIGNSKCSGLIRIEKNDEVEEIVLSQELFTWKIHTTDQPELNKKVGIKWEVEDIHTMEKDKWNDSTK